MSRLKKLPDGSWIIPSYIKYIEVAKSEEIPGFGLLPNRVIIHLGDNDRRSLPCESYEDAEYTKDLIAKMCL